MFFKKRLHRTTIVHGKPMEDTFGNALHLTRHIPIAKTCIISMSDGNMSAGELYSVLLTADTKAIILTDVFFPHHTDVIKKMFLKERIYFTRHGKVASIKTPPLIICTSSPKEMIPFNELDGGLEKQVGYLNCSFNQ